MEYPQAQPLGEEALLLQWDERVDARLNAAVHAAATIVRSAALPGVHELVPAYASLLVRFDASIWSTGGRRDAHAALHAKLIEILAAGGGKVEVAPPPARVHEIAVRYGGEDGPDLAGLASTLGLDEAEVITRHTAPLYRVAMLGFAPGFAYLLGLDPRLAAPRRPRPRTRVPAGSVAIGGLQTGIYPAALPGGWQLVGRTARVLFDAARQPPALLQPGDGVRLVALFPHAAASGRASV